MRPLTAKAYGLVLLTLFFIQPASAMMSPQTQSEFCTIAKDLKNFKNVIVEKNNRLAFRNDGGLFNGGVCWWHSRLQRALTYLSIFHPEKNKPTAHQVLQILNRLKRLDSVVEIPGYENVHTFSKDWEDVIQKFLNNWQIEDGFVRQAWVRGLAGSAKENANRMAIQMDKLYHQVVELGRISYIKLQLPGIDSHALLVVGMQKTFTGYDVTIVDSNSLNVEEYAYRYGDGYFDDYDTAIYLERVGDFRKITGAISNYCVQSSR